MTNELTQKQITSNVATRIEAMKGEGLLIAPNYSVSNALSSAYYALKNSSSGNLLEKCTPDSVYNALLDMVVQGLSPAKTQCYFIPYGNKATLERSYFGTMKVVKQLSTVKDIYAKIIYEGDEFEAEVVDGRWKFVSHKSSWKNQNNPIEGAYCVIEKTDGEKILTIMTKEEIDVSWSQSKNKSVQNKFPQEMAKRTIIERAAKDFFNTSDDSDLFIDAVNRTTANEYDNERNVKDITPSEPVETLDAIMGEVVEPEEAPEVQEPEKPKKEPRKKKEVIEQEVTTTDTSHPTEEIPNFDEETGEVFEEISLLEGNTTNIKEQ